MQERIIECVPNFSEGRNSSIIKSIADTISEVDGVRLLDVDSGYDANRTVYTFVGSPDSVAEAAFRAVAKSAELIDMTKHHGEHPRIGACDVMPFIPVSGITMDETVEIARGVAKRVGEELFIPVYCYEAAAFSPKRCNLANCRSGEYEKLPSKLADPEWQPDYGPSVFNAKSGLSVIGARDFLVAFNVNLNTVSVQIANEIAASVRESGRLITNEKGEKERVYGMLKCVKAIGWYMKEYGKAQVSMNLTNINVTPIHEVFETVSDVAQAMGVKVTGSELIGLIPKSAIVEAGRYFAKNHHGSDEMNDNDLINMAIKRMGLDELRPFDVDKKIL